MTNRRNTEPDQILSGKFGQYFAVDVVLEERIRIMLEPQTAEPLGDLDRHRLASQFTGQAVAARGGSARGSQHRGIVYR